MTPQNDWIKDGTYYFSPLGFPSLAPNVMGAHRMSLTKAPKPWATEHEACVGCGMTDQPHKAFGFCRSCYEKRRRAVLERVAA